MTRHPHVTLLSGLSGAGKNTALRAIEDAGLRVIDALPAVAIAESIREILREGPVAIVVDVRCGDIDAAESAILVAAAEAKAPVSRLFIDATNEALIRRYAESRRPHPMAADGCTIEEAIERERAAIAGLRERAEVRILTDDLEPRRFGSALLEYLDGARPSVRPVLSLVSFGFKHGLPAEAEWVFDVRSLPNPYYDPTLRARNGTDPAVARVAIENPRGLRMIALVREATTAALRAAAVDGRHGVTVAIGCTGGIHRSVAVAEAVATDPEIVSLTETIHVHHRDLARR